MSDGAVAALSFVLVIAFQVGILLLGVGLALLPTIIAFRRRHPDRWLITATSLLLGATGVGWVVALIWALRFELPSAETAVTSDADAAPRDLQAAQAGGSPPSVTPPSATPLSTAAALGEIERLSGLRAAGHLSEAEFADLKTGVLRRV